MPSITDTFAAVRSLNSPDVPIVYAVEGDKIVARWDVVKAQTLYPNELKTIDQKYSVTVTLDEAKGTYTSKDHETKMNVSVTPGKISFGSSTFAGKKSGKEFHLQLGGISKTPDGITPALVWSFDSARIKEPLFAFLEQHGWTKKRGLFG